MASKTSDSHALRQPYSTPQATRWGRQADWVRDEASSRGGRVGGRGASGRADGWLQ